MAVHRRSTTACGAGRSGSPIERLMTSTPVALRSAIFCFASAKWYGGRSLIKLDSCTKNAPHDLSQNRRSGYPPPFMGQEERTLPAGRNPLRGSVFERNTQTAPLRQACACSGGVLPHIPFATDCQRESGLGRRPQCLVDCHSTTRSSVPFKRPRIRRYQTLGRLVSQLPP